METVDAILRHGGDPRGKGMGGRALLHPLSVLSFFSALLFQCPPHPVLLFQCPPLSVLPFSAFLFQCPPLSVPSAFSAHHTQCSSFSALFQCPSFSAPISVASAFSAHHTQRSSFSAPLSVLLFQRPSSCSAHHTQRAYFSAQCPGRRHDAAPLRADRQRAAPPHSPRSNIDCAVNIWPESPRVSQARCCTSAR